MPAIADRTEALATIRIDLGAIFVSLELSRSTWLVTSLLPGGGEKMSKHSVPSGDIAGLLDRLRTLQERTRLRTGRVFPLAVIQEAGLDGFWIHRVLVGKGIESHVVDPASVATCRRQRRAKTDKLDGDALVRTLLAYKRGEPRVCAMVQVPTPEEEDRRRLSRERRTLLKERVQHSNRIKGLLFGQGISGYEPLRPDCRQRLGKLQTADGRPLPRYLKGSATKPVSVRRTRSPVAGQSEEPDHLLRATSALPRPTSSEPSVPRQARRQASSCPGAIPRR
jgi:transposase